MNHSKYFHPASYPFVIPAVLFTCVVGYLWPATLFITAPITVWLFAFFRNPQRVTIDLPNGIIAPADGKIISIAPAALPKELQQQMTALTKTDGSKKTTTKLLRIAIFMNVFNVHVNRFPCSGKILAICHQPGKFINASRFKECDDNERSGMLIAATPQVTVAVVQIAGLIARRIVNWVGANELAAAGQRYGLIRFGSRVDVYFPQSAEVLVAVGQVTRAGETLLAKLK